MYSALHLFFFAFAISSPTSLYSYLIPSFLDTAPLSLQTLPSAVFLTQTGSICPAPLQPGAEELMLSKTNVD
jgi:hypothetical protein